MSHKMHWWHCIFSASQGSSFNTGWRQMRRWKWVKKQIMFLLVYRFMSRFVCLWCD